MPKVLAIATYTHSHSVSNSKDIVVHQYTVSKFPALPTSSMTMVLQSCEMILGHLHICGVPLSMITKDSEEVKHTAGRPISYILMGRKR